MVTEPSYRTIVLAFRVIAAVYDVLGSINERSSGGNASSGVAVAVAVVVIHAKELYRALAVVTVTVVVQITFKYVSASQRWRRKSTHSQQV